MNTTTLRGIFPDPKPIHRRNFIKENIKQVKQMQGLLQESGLLNTRNPRGDKYRTVPPKVSSNAGSVQARKSKHQIVRSQSQNSKLQTASQENTINLQTNSPPKLQLKPRARHTKVQELQDQRFMNRAMQTERTDNLTALYETGVIKYPSPNVLSQTSPTFKHKSLDSGDQTNRDLVNGMEGLVMHEKDYVKENIKNIRQRISKSPTNNKDPSKLPAHYRKGEVPKYILERRDEQLKDREEGEPECPPGHVLLPDEERKETLRVLRQSYADRIQELNSMPVRSDTLKMRRRKMEIEDELKKIDEGIKVFQRPKVFVKINA